MIKKPLEYLQKIRQSLVSKLILTVGLTLLLSISTWSYFSIRYQKERLMKEVTAEAARLSNTIKLGTHYAMMLNARDEITQIIENIAKQKQIDSIRIYNKEGQIKFSNITSEVDRTTNIKDEACYICHRTDPPLKTLRLDERTRIISPPDSYRKLGVISPICNEPGCATGDCHVHPEGKLILGALDVVVSLDETDQEILFLEKGVIGLAVSVFLVTSLIIFLFVIRFIIRPIRKLIQGTGLIAEGEYVSKVDINQHDEMGRLADAINLMGESIHEKQTELNRSRDEYQNLFELVPCIITVQDRNFRLIQYNREFEKKFAPRQGDFCYRAYKGRSEKCVNCPVEKTFQDGLPHFGEEAGARKDGTQSHWLVSTSPIRNADGDIVAAMEMNLDITHRKELENKLEQSEKKYHDIFNNIPNPVFVIEMDTLEILDGNERIKEVYGFKEDELIGRPFTDLFVEEERGHYKLKVMSATAVTQVKQRTKDGRIIFVNMRISPSEYPGKKVLLVTTSDITKRLETEQQLIQASKMATLGEMATGVAHELNQPLSVIKTASRFFMRKIKQNEKIEDDIAFTMMEKIDGNVDRASKIINHMRQFARKSEMDFEKVHVNRVLESAFEIFSQQLKVRGIETIWDIEDGLPEILADDGRLEQVFINLLLNARDAIEDKCAQQAVPVAEKIITIRTRSKNNTVMVEIADTGIGMDNDVAAKVFEPFYTTKEVGKGTGLGLSISYGIVKECGGMISVVSEKGVGTTFSLTFPIRGEND